MNKPDKAMITSAETRLYLGKELLPLIAVNLVEWEDKRSAQVSISGPLEALDALDKIVAGVDLDVIAFPRLTPVEYHNPHKRVIASFKHLWNVYRWIDNLIVNHPSGEVQVAINVSFMCSLEFSNGGNDGQASS